MSETPQNPAADPSATPTKRPRAAQDQIIQAYIADSRKFLKVTTEDADIRHILEAHGYAAADLADGAALANTAADTFEARAAGMGKQKLTGAALSTAIKAARDEYAAFREIARASFPAAADRAALSLTGDVPDDTGRFITLAEASYGAAGKEPRAAKLTKRGYPAARLATLLANLDELTATGGEQDQSEGDAIEDTAGRDTAYENLKTYMKELRGTARGALRGKPALLAKLEL